MDRQKVNSRAALANAASVGGLLLLLVSVVAPLFWESNASLTLVLLLSGGITAMVGIYLANRWVRRPRPEESLDKSLKPFDDKYRLYHYPALPCEHVLLTPSGVVALEVVNLAGSFSYRDRRWKEAMTIGRALRYMVEPRVGDPIAIAQGLDQELRRWFKDHLESHADVPVEVLTVFTHPSVELEIEDAAVPAHKIAKLRKHAVPQGGKLAPELYEELAACLERATLS
ncbi:MAG: nuclease-related domain-containing protein [Chloroflexota bacterium]